MKNSKKSIILAVAISVLSLNNAFTQTTSDGSIADQIREKGAQVVKALNDNDAESLLAQFWKSEEALFIINGFVIEGYEQIAGGLGQNISGRNMNLSVINEEVKVIDENNAMHIVRFKQDVSYTDGRPAHKDEGAWVAEYRNMDGAWQVVLVHESYHPVEQ